MATIDRYKIKITVDGKDQIIDTSQAVDDLTQKVGNFAKVGIAALAGLTASAAKMADTMVDLAGTAGMSASKIYQMSVAAQAAGGDFGQVEQMLLKYSNSVEGAINGNDKLVKSFEKIGVTREDLQNLDDEQLFQKVVRGLGNMEDGAEKTALAIELLGKKAATTDLRKFADDISQAADPNIERTLQNAAKAVDSLEMAFRNLQLAALQTFGPMLELIGKFELDVEGAQKAIQVFGALIAAAFAASTLASIARLIPLMAALAVKIAKAATAQTVLTALIPGVGTAIVLGALAAGTAAYVALGRAINSANDSVDQLNDNAGAFVGPMLPTDTGANVRELQLTQAERLANAARRTTEQMISQNEQANILRRTMIGLIGIDRDRANLEANNSRARVDMNNELFSIEQQIQTERERGSDTNEAVIQQLERQKGIIKDQYNETIRLNDAEYERLKVLRDIDRQLQSDLRFIEASTAGVSHEINAALMTSQALGLISGNLISASSKSAAEAARNAITNRELNARLSNATTEEEKRNIKELIEMEKIRHYNVMEGLKDEEQAYNDLQQSRIAGVLSGMEQLTQQFTPFQMAQDAVLSTWNNIASAIDDVARGGKASFKDMARSIIVDLGAMIAKAMVFKAISTTLGAFGVSLPGLATGGPAKAGQPYIVGEKGPELFVPKQSGTVIPNNKLSTTSSPAPQSQQPQPVVNNVFNISAVDAKSVAQLFYENRKSMLGTMAIAQRELPYGAMG